jgi:hypothetical protein
MVIQTIKWSLIYFHTMPYYMATHQVLMSKLLNELKKKNQDNCNVYLITTLQLTKSSCQNGEQKKTI